MDREESCTCWKPTLVAGGNAASKFCIPPLVKGCILGSEGCFLGVVFLRPLMSVALWRGKSSHFHSALRTLAEFVLVRRFTFSRLEALSRARPTTFLPSRADHCAFVSFGSSFCVAKCRGKCHHVRWWVHRSEKFMATGKDVPSSV